MLSYTHYTLEERKCLQQLLKEGCNLRYIARATNRSVSSVSREIKRNKSKKGYGFWYANNQSIHRRRASHPMKRLNEDTELGKYVRKKLKVFWSPECIAETWRLKHPDDPVGWATIYRWLKRDKLSGFSRKTHLRRKGKKIQTRNANYMTIHPDRLIEDWPEEIVKRMYNELTDAGMAPKTIKNIAAVMHKAFNIAIKQDLINSNPCDKAEIPSAPRKEIKPLADAEIPEFLKAIQGHSMENAFALCLFAGLREGECLGLSWSQVDFEKGTIVVSQQLQKQKVKGGKYFIAPFTKSNKSRTLMPPMIAFDYLKAERKRQLANQLAAGSLWDNSYNLVFTNETGRHLAIYTFYNAFKKVVTSIGRPDARPHDLRHTAATVAIASGADIKSVQSLLGHATASFTLNVYAHTFERMMADTASRVQGYYDNLKSGLK